MGIFLLHLTVLLCRLVVQSHGWNHIIMIPSGPNSTLERYLCNSTLRANTTLMLSAGEHFISPGPFCSVFNVSNIHITGAGVNLTTVRCDAENPRGFRFLSIQNLTVEMMTFVCCGQLQEKALLTPHRQFSKFTSPVTIYVQDSSLLTIRQVELTNFSGIGIVGSNIVSSVILTRVKFSNCNKKNCSGALFYANTSSVATQAPSILIQACVFKDLKFFPSVKRGYVFIGAALTVWGNSSVVVGDSQFSNLNSSIGAAISSIEAKLLIDKCNFTNNIGNERGAVSSFYSHLAVKNSSFTGNIVTDGEGGAIQAYLSNLDVSWCWFEKNTAAIGGAIFIFGNYMSKPHTLTRTSLIRNYAGIGAALFASDYAKSNGAATYSLYLVDSVVKDNRCSCGQKDQTKGAAVYFNEVSDIHIDGTQFSENSPQGALQVLAGSVHMQGKVRFQLNEGENGGALSLSSNARLYFYQNCSVEFVENLSSRAGGAVYIQGDPNIPKYNYIGCAIHFLGEHTNYSIKFINNTALGYGQSIYATPMYNCHITAPSELNVQQYGNLSELYTQLFNITPNTGNQILSFPLNVNICSCDNNTPCYVEDGIHYITSYPGRTVRFYATPLDYNNHTSPSVIYTDIYLEGNGNHHNIRLAPQQNIQWINKDCDLMEYQIFGPENTSFHLHLSTFPGDVPNMIVVILEPCERGFMLTTNNVTMQSVCSCSPFLTAFNVDCNATDGMVSIKGKKNFWVGFYHKGNVSHLAIAYTCPLDYCKSTISELSLATPDALCTNGRNGILCGRCDSELSVVFGSPECKVCSDIWLLTILLYGGLGIVLVAVLFMLNLTVTQGTIYGLIFYANLIGVSDSIFFSHSYLRPLQVFMSFINLDLGFTLCFYNGMDDIAKTGLQFVFPAYLLALTVTVVVACRYCLQSDFSGKCLGRFSNFVGKRAVSVLATLIYLSYSKLLRTVISIFTFVTINTDMPEKTYAVWFYDGNVKYLNGRHLPLFLVALAITVAFIVPYTLALTLIPIIDRFSDHNRLFNWLHQKANLLKPMNDAYFASYRGLRRSWLGVRLLLLVFLYGPTSVLSSENPSLLLYIHGVMVILFVFVQTQIKPFSYFPHLTRMNIEINFFSNLLNWLDSFYMINYATLALTVSYLLANDGSDLSHNIAVGILVSLSGVIFCATFIYHVIIAFFKVCKTNWEDSNHEWVVQKLQEESLVPTESCKPPTVVEIRLVSVYGGDLREPLIENLQQADVN